MPPLAIDFENYEPGDIFAHVLAGLPGFEHVQAPGRTGAGDRESTAIARAGFAGAGRRLPHLATIQASFGRHDVSSVEAFVGGPARDAADALGAKAYAAEGKVAFAGTPDLHTAAHEAAHVVQQRAGVAGDACEHHADAVADLVVTGKSAEALLSRAPGGRGVASVQRKPKAAAHATPDTDEVCGGVRGPSKQDDVTLVFNHANNELNTALDKSAVLAIIVAILVDDGGENAAANDTLRSAARALAKKMQTSRTLGRDVGSLLLGIAEIAVGLGELASPGKWASGLLKVVKGGDKSGSAAVDLTADSSATTKLATLVAAITDQMVDIAESQAKLIEAIGDYVSVDIRGHLANARTDLDHGLGAIAKARALGCRGENAYDAPFLADTAGRLIAAAGTSRSIAHVIRPSGVMLTAAGAVGSKAMRPGTGTRVLFDQVQRLLADGRRDEIALVQQPFVKTVVFLNGRIRRGEEMFRPVEIRPGKHRFLLRTSQSVGAYLVAHGVEHREALRAAPSAKGGVEYGFPIGREKAAALTALTAVGLRSRTSEHVDFAVDSADNVVAGSPYIDPTGDDWLGSDDLAEMWKAHISDVAGFVFADRAYRFTAAGSFVLVRSEAK